MAAADQDESAGALLQGALQAGQVVRDRLRQQFHLAAPGLQRLREPGPQRTEVDAVRVREQLLKAQSVRSYAEAVAVGAETQHHVQPPLGAGVAGEQRGEFAGVTAVHGRVRFLDRLAEGLVDDHLVDGGGIGPVHARHGEDQPRQDLRLGHPARLQRDRGTGVANLVADGEGVEGEVVVRALGGRGRGQDDVGVACGLVEVRVDADHEVERFERLVEPVAVGRGEHGVGGDDQQRAHRFALLGGGVDLLREGGEGQFALGLRVPAHAGVPAPEGEAAARSGGARGLVGGGLREERPAGPVEVAGEDVQDVDEPAGQGAVRDGAAADAPVDGGGGGGGELAGEGADDVGLDVAGGGDGFGGELPQGVGHFLDALDVRGGFGEALVEEHLGHRRQQQRVGAGPHGDVPVGELRGAGAPRVDHDERAAAGLERLEFAGEVGGRAQTAVGFQRVGADQEQMVGVIQVGHGDGVRVAEEQSAGDVLGHLVHRGGGEDAARAEPGEQQRRVEGAGHGVHVGVAEDDADGVRAVPLDDGPDAGGDRVEGLLPGGLAQLAVPAHERGAQPVGVGVDGPEGGALGADESLAEDVVAVTSGTGDARPLDGEGQAAGGLAQGTDTQGGAGHGSSRGGGYGDARTRPSIPTGMHGGEALAATSQSSTRARYARSISRISSMIFWSPSGATRKAKCTRVSAVSTAMRKTRRRSSSGSRPR
ncbi:hypothetical protein SVIOM74S_09712 [Streptomyces violarus]